MVNLICKQNIRVGQQANFRDTYSLIEPALLQVLTIQLTVLWPVVCFK